MTQGTVRRAQQGRQEHRGNRRCRPTALGALLDLIKDGTINGKIAKDVFAEMFETGDDAARHRRGEGPEAGHRHRRDREAIDELMAATPTRWRNTPGKEKLFGWFVGQVMKATGGKANPAVVNDILKKKLAG